MRDLTAFQRDLLYVISAINGGTGLQIKDEMEEYYEKNIHHGRLYPNLDTIVNKGLATKRSLDDRTVHYELTRRGNRRIEDRREWENSLDIER